MEEKELVRLCKKKNRKAQEALYRLFASKMYAVCLMYGKDREEAQDILHDAFIKIFKKIDSYKGTGSLEGWVRRIVVNTALDIVRKRSKKIIVEWEENINIPVNEQEEDILPSAELVRRLLEKIPQGARMVFNLFVVEGLSHADIAKKMGISEGTSKSQYSRARKLIQAAFLKARVE